MFCTECGVELPENAKFCFSCGTKITKSDNDPTTNNMSLGSNGKFVNAKCTNCGAKLEVNPDLTKAQCSYCGAEFIVEQAINNYNVQIAGNMNISQATIHVQGSDKKNLLARAHDFEENSELNEALDYYNRVLDIDFSDDNAREGAKRVKEKIINFAYFDEIVPGFFSDDRKIVTRDALHIVDSKGTEKIYYFAKMSKLETSLGCLQFTYEGTFSSVIVGGSKNKEIMAFIQNARRGILPSYHQF